MASQSILVGIDFSECSIAAARWVTEFYSPECALTLVHVVPPPERPGFAQSRLPFERIQAMALEDAAMRMRDAMATLPASTRTEIRVGTPHEIMRQLAAETGADLIAIGPHGVRPGTHSWLGTTAERIVRSSPVPVLVCANPPSARPRRILVPIDDFSLTETILAAARDLAERFDADVKLLHVWSDSVYGYVASMSRLTTRGAADAGHQLEKELNDAATHWLADYTAAGFQSGRVTATVTHGKPGAATLDMAAGVHAELIIMGRRGSGLVAPTLLGSTLRTVLNGAPCPVLVVVPPGEMSGHR